MSQLHEQVASDPYWSGPVFEDTERLPFLTEIYDVFNRDSVLLGIDKAYREIAERGAQAQPIENGQGIELISAGGILKVVEDMRVHPKKITRGRSYDTPEIFDRQAQTMVDELLYQGEQTGLKVETESGSVDIARRTIYLRNATSQRQMIGKPSELLGKGGSPYNAVFMSNGISVGHTTQYETRKDRVQRRIVSAKVITPRGPKRARKIFDLGAVEAKLIPPALA